jgi:hypothetical protein
MIQVRVYRQDFVENVQPDYRYVRVHDVNEWSPGDLAERVGVVLYEVNDGRSDNGFKWCL